uniref:Nanos-type domain-containing protein n=1 Tax=Megaselia scalaris TaxID=36166 RepID=T1GBL4_MEGSC
MLVRNITYVYEYNKHSDENINDFETNGYDPNDELVYVRNSYNFNKYNQYQFNDQKKNKNRKVVVQQNQPFCVFCYNNNEPDAVVRSHSVKDSYGRVLCPKLRTYTCPICHVSGDYAHTVKYCPQKPIVTMEDTVKFESNKLTRSYFKPGMKV